MELQQLRGFLAVAKTASVTEAAHQLRLTPSSVSVQIKKLEQELGVRLFDRAKKGLILTGSGKLFLEIVLPAMESLRLAEVIVRDTAGELAGNIVIATVYDIEQYYLPLLADFAKTYKRITLTILMRDNTEILSLIDKSSMTVIKMPQTAWGFLEENAYAIIQAFVQMFRILCTFHYPYQCSRIAPGEADPLQLGIFLY